MVKKSYRFDTIPAVTDGQTDRHVAVAMTRSTHSVERVKSWGTVVSKKYSHVSIWADTLNKKCELLTCLYLS